MVRRGASRFVREHRVKLESARFIDQIWMREALAQDPAITAAVVEQSRATGEPLPLLRERVDAYAEEIAPYFSMSWYYRFGAVLARWAVHFTYEVVLDTPGYHRQLAQVPDGAIRVYVINHRSNADPLVLAHALLDKTAMSYAVGEWALVWPLHHLFRLFGSYFVRRGEEDPLYHVVLERFVQLLAGHGGSTGFFIEGGLSRDGSLRPARAGLLAYLINVRRDHPDREIVFLPVGLNYDRVLEDRTLLRERHGPVDKPSLAWRLITLGAIVFWTPLLVGANLLKVATRSHRKFGYCAIHFGEPLALTDWPGGDGLHELPAESQRVQVQQLATELLEGRIGAVVPATPVPLLCLALERVPDGRLDALQRAVREDLARLRERGAPIALGDAFASIEARRTQEEGVPGVDSALLAQEEAELVVLLATYALERRRVVVREEDRLRVRRGDEPVLAYYANSIRHHLGTTGTREAAVAAEE